ncbi:Flp family type IVb pilin [Orrella sp. JC864]|uniref:Flp family type IVb pilin n=1 Tax=Orrella sp. JC864 TaxID=3120298 RepID=UPI00300B9041
MKSDLIEFWNDEEGATAIEYGLIAGLIAVAIITALGLLSDELDGVFRSIASALGGEG